jgi:hypothetical protein
MPSVAFVTWTSARADRIERLRAAHQAFGGSGPGRRWKSALDGLTHGMDRIVDGHLRILYGTPPWWEASVSSLPKIGSYVRVPWGVGTAEGEVVGGYESTIGNQVVVAVRMEGTDQTLTVAFRADAVEQAERA